MTPNPAIPNIEPPQPKTCKISSKYHFRYISHYGTNPKLELIAEPTRTPTTHQPTKS
jgi:hypothetical protein